MLFTVSSDDDSDQEYFQIYLFIYFNDISTHLGLFYVLSFENRLLYIYICILSVVSEKF